MPNWWGGVTHIRVAGPHPLWGWAKVSLIGATKIFPTSHFILSAQASCDFTSSASAGICSRIESKQGHVRGDASAVEAVGWANALLGSLLKQELELCNPQQDISLVVVCSTPTWLRVQRGRQHD